MDIDKIIALIASLSAPANGDLMERTFPSTANQVHPVVAMSCPKPIPHNEIEGKTILCGKVAVPEDHARPGGRMVELQFAILKAKSAYPEPDPLVYLQGGPGGSAMRQIPLIDRLFTPWRDRRDVVMYDQRSAGLSGNSVNCYKALSENQLAITLPHSEEVMPATEILASCVQELEASGIDLSLYNTTQNARDVQTIVNALGYDAYNIYGISYGTKLALEVMRVAPQNVRSVIIDGVAPSWVHLYNSFAFKTDEVVETVARQCAEDPVCDTAYPQLDRVIIDTLNRAKAGSLTADGEKVTVETVLAPFNARNGRYDSASITRYIPAYVYELNRGKEMPTVTMLVRAGFDLPKAGEQELLTAASGLADDQQAIVRQLADNHAIEERIRVSTGLLIDQLRNAVESNRVFGPIAGMFDHELERAMLAVVKGDPSKKQNALADYTAMQTAKPSREVLQSFVNSHFDGDHKARLSALVAAMSSQEVQASFVIIRRSTYAARKGFFDSFYLDVYACQEDLPFNNFEGYKKVAAGLKYPHIADIYDTVASNFFSSCEPFKKNERANWHDPVVSDIPTLSFGSLFDIQTPASWAKLAVEKLTNAQAFMIPEAGHGAAIYQPCVAEMGVAFFDDPSRKFDDSCAESIRIDWHIAEWVAKPAQ